MQGAETDGRRERPNERTANSPAPGFRRVRPDVDVVLLVGDEADLAQVHGLVAAVEADVALPGLARVSRRPDDLALDVGQHALVLRVGAGVGHPGRCRLAACCDWRTMCARLVPALSDRL